MFLEKQSLDGRVSRPRAAKLPTVFGYFAFFAAAAFIAVSAVAPFTTSQAQAEEVQPLQPGERLSQELMTEATAESTFTIERFEEVVAPAPKPSATRGSGVAPVAGTPDPGTAQAIALGYVGAGPEFDCLVALWNKESRWNVFAENRSSGAYGIPQALPGNKMASAGADWQTNPDTQIRWGLGYIQGRYGSPCAAWAKSQAVGWY